MLASSAREHSFRSLPILQPHYATDSLPSTHSLCCPPWPSRTCSELRRTYQTPQRRCRRPWSLWRWVVGRRAGKTREGGREGGRAGRRGREGGSLFAWPAGSACVRTQQCHSAQRLPHLQPGAYGRQGPANGGLPAGVYSASAPQAREAVKATRHYCCILVLALSWTQAGLCVGLPAHAQELGRLLSGAEIPLPPPGSVQSRLLEDDLEGGWALKLFPGQYCSLSASSVCTLQSCPLSPCARQLCLLNSHVARLCCATCRARGLTAAPVCIRLNSSLPHPTCSYYMPLRSLLLPSSVYAPSYLLPFSVCDPPLSSPSLSVLLHSSPPPLCPPTAFVDRGELIQDALEQRHMLPSSEDAARPAAVPQAGAAVPQAGAAASARAGAAGPNAAGAAGQPAAVEQLRRLFAVASDPRGLKATVEVGGQASGPALIWLQVAARHRRLSGSLLSRRPSSAASTAPVSPASQCCSCPASRYCSCPAWVPAAKHSPTRQKLLSISTHQHWRWACNCRTPRPGWRCTGPCATSCEAPSVSGWL